ncbi:MAG TPA: DUF1800 domain-containing protein [Fimbriimonadaceae bacterium]|nr:DUF1800 domain-containing protein [Fimbriimonadaceae bacterium]
MDKRRQIRHLLRRFGFGPSVAEVNSFEKLGVDGTIAHLLDYDKIDEGFPISQWEICFEPKQTDMYVDPQRMALWWALRLLMTKRPLQENLTLFWHNHLAVSGGKVEFGPSMTEYIQVLRDNATGHFPTMVEQVSQTPAMLRWLDTDMSEISHPNENFARELMELFTMGVGNYTETDVRQAARAFTGWSLRYYIYEAGGPHVQERLRECALKNVPMIAASFAPGLCDLGPKTVLGKTGDLSAHDIIEMVSTRPETATRTTKKLWEWFGYPDPEPKIVEKLAATFKKSGYHIKPVIKEIATMPEFWSAKCIRGKIKSPADFVIGIFHQLELDDFLASLRPATTTPETPLPPLLRGIGYILWQSMSQQGLEILFPPDVSGWRWGTAWMTSANIAERMKFSATVCNVGNSDKGLVNYFGNKIKADYKPVTAEDVVNGICDIFDVEFEKDKLAILTKAATAAGGPHALDTPGGASNLCHAVCRLIFASPEFQMC